MAAAHRYTIAPSVIHEVFDDEVVIANLDHGTYYSVGGSGVDAWVAVCDGVAMHRVAEAIAAASGADAAVVGDELQRLVDDLVAEALISPDGLAADDPPHAPTRATYASPTLERFTDMQQLLLLDPIHDVDDAGWPVPRDQH
jgi:hypothetical protein